MYRRLSALLLCFLLLLLFISHLYSQDIELKEQPDRAVYLYQDGMPRDVVDLEEYTQSGKIEPLTSHEILPPKIVTGPAPEPYPAIGMMEKRYEQLGESSDASDGIWFINGNLWVPGKWAIVRWKIRIPDANERLASEFAEDITLSLWVDWNNDKKWSQNEKMLCENINLQEYFPTFQPDIDVYYLAMFRVPSAAMFESLSEGVTKAENKVWARGVISYNDPDTSPDGECLFGECEDYNINYFEILKDKKTQI